MASCYPHQSDSVVAQGLEMSAEVRRCLVFGQGMEVDKYVMIADASYTGPSFMTLYRKSPQKAIPMTGVTLL